jgi:hypothetical protein
MDESREKADESDDKVDSRLIPGGAEPRTPTQQGMAGLDHDAFVGGRDDLEQTRHGDRDRDAKTGE